MSYGYGIGDLLAVIKDCKSIADAIRTGPQKYKELCSDADSLHRVLENLRRNVLDSDGRLNAKAEARKEDLRQLVDKCSEALGAVWCMLSENRKLKQKLSTPSSSQALWQLAAKYRMGSADLSSIRTRLTMHLTAINLFQQDMQNARMEDRLTTMGGFATAPVAAQQYSTYNNFQINIQGPSQNSFQSGFSMDAGPAHYADCDGCDRRIRGIRYRCNSCSDFDYCHNCFLGAKRTHPAHGFNPIHPPDEPVKPPATARVLEIEDGEEDGLPVDPATPFYQWSFGR